LAITETEGCLIAAAAIIAVQMKEIAEMKGNAMAIGSIELLVESMRMASADGRVECNLRRALRL
jgi:hypothetical protein